MNGEHQSFRVLCTDVSAAWIGSLARCITRVQVFSPYVTSDVAERAMAAPFPPIVELHTRFDLEAFAAGASSLDTLDRLLGRGHPVFEVPRLHAKVFVVTGRFATIGSQNLTARGRRNREVSVVIRDPTLLDRLNRQLTNWTADRRPITREMIAEAKRAVLPLMQFMRRVKRACRTAEKEIATAELERERQRDEERTRSAREVVAYQEKREAFLNKLGDGSSVPEKFCRDVLWNATEWYRQGRFVPARRDAFHMVRGKWGWELPLGKNRFWVESGIRLVRAELDEMFPIERPRPFQLTSVEMERLQLKLTLVVAGHGHEPFPTYKSDAQGRMWFGNHAVNLPKTIRAILDFSDFG